jgi:hypothetical protein
LQAWKRALSVIAFKKCLVLIVVLTASGVFADPYASAPTYDDSADWCTEDLYYSTGKKSYLPDGALTQVGPYIFRVCQGGSRGSTPDRRAMRFFYNPARVEGLSSDKVMTGLMINSLGSWEGQLDRLLDSHKLVGQQVIGREIYGVYRYVFPETGELGRKTHLYEEDTTAENGGLPPHMFDCVEPVQPPYLLQGRCTLLVGYDKIFANLLFLSISPDGPRIPVERFPEFAMDVQRMLETADATNDLSRYRSELPFLD